MEGEGGVNRVREREAGGMEANLPNAVEGLIVSSSDVGSAPYLITPLCQSIHHWPSPPAHHLKSFLSVCLCVCVCVWCGVV